MAWLPARGGRLQPRPAWGWLAAARPLARGGRPQGQQPARGDHGQLEIACRGDDTDRRGGRPLATTEAQ
ncbi:hypothetical protein GW17_00048328 [Ensete ventricosum]|nr:hypothetical protein GW17_00048328 [Ensete ventricosum]RZS20574.1 hypothetical protein BHM03_00053107 [Ensete ventricosum]